MLFSPSRRICSQLAALSGKAEATWNQLVPVFVSLHRRKPRRMLAVCAFEGFYDPETLKGYTFAWTVDHASIRCRFAQRVTIRHLWLEIACTAPDGSRFSVHVNGTPLAEGVRKNGDGTVHLRVPKTLRTSSLDIEIHTSTFTPADKYPNTGDHRTLGIGLRGIALAASRWHYRRQMDFKPPLPKQVLQFASRHIGRRAA